MKHYSSIKNIFLIISFTALTSGVSVAQFLTAQAYAPCSESVLVSNPLTVEGLLSPTEPSIEDVQLVSLANGRKAVVFGVRGKPEAFRYGKWNFRYAVRWYDSCGRLLPQGSGSIDGFDLYPNEYRVVEAVSFQKDAVRATLRVYLDSN